MVSKSGDYVTKKLLAFHHYYDLLLAFTTVHACSATGAKITFQSGLNFSNCPFQNFILEIDSNKELRYPID